MPLVCPNVGEVFLLEYIVGSKNADNPVLHLFSNNVTPDDTTVLSDLVEVATSTGYAAATMLSDDWSTVQVAGVSSVVYPEVVFNFNTNVQTYGYYVTDQSNNLLWLERFDAAPYSIPAQGGTVTITPKLSLS